MTQPFVPPASSRAQWLAVGSAALAGTAVLLVWLFGTSTGTLREQLKLLQPWWLDACVLAGLIAAVCVYRTVDAAALRREAPRLAMLALTAGYVAQAATTTSNRMPIHTS